MSYTRRQLWLCIKINPPFCFFTYCWYLFDYQEDVLLWIPTYGRAKAGRPARTYIQQLCEDTGCCPEDLPRAMNDREEWRERVRDIRAASTIWWWWWYIRLIPEFHKVQSEGESSKYQMGHDMPNIISCLIFLWFGLVLWNIKNCWLFNTKSCFYVYIKYMFCKQILQLNDQTVLFLTIQFSISQQS